MKKKHRRPKRRVRRRRRNGPVQLLLPLQMPLAFAVVYLSRTPLAARHDEQPLDVRERVPVGEQAFLF